jgi:hypothetical protein
MNPSTGSGQAPSTGSGQGGFVMHGVPGGKATFVALMRELIGEFGPLQIKLEGDVNTYRRGLQLTKPEGPDGSAGPAQTHPTK